MCTEALLSYWFLDNTFTTPPPPAPWTYLICQAQGHGAMAAGVCFDAFIRCYSMRDFDQSQTQNAHCVCANAGGVHGSK